METSILILKSLATTLSAVKAVGTIAVWLAKNKQDPLRRAIDETTTKHEHRFPDIRGTLGRALENSEFLAQLDKLVAGPDTSIERAAQELARQTDFYLPSRSEANAELKDVLHDFLIAYDGAQLDSDQGVRYSDAKSAYRHQEIKALSSSATLGAELRARIQEIRLAQKARSYDVVRELWAREENALGRAGGVDPAVAFEVYSAIANLAFSNDRTREAADYFNRAWNAHKAHPRASAHLAMSRALRGNRDGALSAIADEPDNDRRRVLTARIHLILGEPQSTLDLLLPRLGRIDSAEESMLIAVSAQMLGDFATAEQAARDAVGMAPDDSVVVHTLAQVLAQKAQRACRGGSPMQAVRLWQEADEAFERACNGATGTRLAEALAARARIAMVLGKIDRALALAEQASRADSGEEWLLLVARIAMDAGIDRSALIRPMADGGNPEAWELLLTAARLFRRPDGRELLCSVRARWPASVPIAIWETAWWLGDDLGDRPTQEWLLKGSPPGEPGRTKLAQARTALRSGQTSDARALLKEASTELSQKNGLALLDLGMAAAAVQENELARTAFEQFGVALSADDAVLCTYLQVLQRVEGGQDQILDLLRSVSLEEAPLTLLEAGLHVLETRGDMNRARELWLALNAKTPTEGRFKLGLAIVEFRLGNTEAAAEIMRSLEPADLDPSSHTRAVPLAIRLGLSNLALRLAFEVWKRSPQDPEVCWNYACAFMELPDDTAAMPEIVRRDTVVKLDFQGETMSVLVADTDSVPAACEVVRHATESEGGAKLVGRHVGDSIVWAQGPGGPVEASVIEVVSPEVFAYRYAMDKAARSPGRAYVRKHRFGPDPLADLEEVVKGTRLARERTLEDLRETPMPLVAAARRLGEKPFELWTELIAGAEPGVRSNLNTRDEQEHERDVAKTAEDFVVDVTALLTFAKLGQLPLLKANRRLWVTQTTIDVLDEQRAHLKRTKGNEFSVSYVAGQLVRSSKAPEVLDAEVELLEIVLRFARELQVVALHRALKPLEESVLSIIGADYVDCLVVAERMALLSDDAIFRNLAKQHGAFGVTSTVNLLTTDRARNRIDAKAFARALVYMVKLNYRDLPICGEALTTMVEEQAPIGDYLVLVGALGREGSDPQSVALVLATHFQQVCETVALWAAAEGYLRACLDRLGGTVKSAIWRAIGKTLTGNRIIVPAASLRLQGMLEAVAKAQR